LQETLDELIFLLASYTKFEGVLGVSCELAMAKFLSELNTFLENQI